MSDFVLRVAEHKDAPAISALFQESFTRTFQHLYPADELAGFLAQQSNERVADWCASADHLLMLGETPTGELLGYSFLGPYDFEAHLPRQMAGRRWWALRQLYLMEAAKGGGLADALMAYAIAESRRRQYQDLLLTVWIDNRRARRFYERHGFMEVGKYPFKVGNTIDDDRIMRRAL